MTQSYNLSQLANNLNTAGRLDATDGLVGAVPPANGGTGLASYAVGDLIYATGTTTLAKLADVATGNVLLSGGVNTAPGYGKVPLTTHVSGILPVANGGTASSTSGGAPFALKGANSDITSVSALASVNGGQLAGLRNRVINGQGWITQRGPVAVSAYLQYGPDCMAASISSGTSISGNISYGSLSGTNSGQGWGILSCSWTSGVVQLAQRIESWNVLDMNSKTVTFSGKLYQDTGGSRTFNIIIQKATAGVNNFTITSTISSTTVVVPTATTTPFSFTTTLGSSDATNGIMLILSDTVANTAVSKTYFTSDWQFEIGSIATTFEQRPYGLELALCQRYYQVAYVGWEGYAGGSSSAGAGYTFSPPMFTTPSVINISDDRNVNTTGGVPSTVNLRPYGGTFYKIATSTGGTGWANTIALSASL